VSIRLSRAAHVLILQSSPQLPALTLVAGGFNCQSTAQIDCTTFDKLSAQKSNSQVILGKYTCLTTADAKSGLGSASGTSTSSAPPKSTTSKAAAASFGVDSAVAGISVVGGLLRMLL
jgi:hypothetical protein